MGLFSFFRRNPYRGTAELLYAAIGRQARSEAFYRDWGVPDTVDGRFDLLVLHSFLVMNRLQDEAEGPAVNQALFDQMFKHMDLALREMGVQDLGVGRRVKVMAEGFNGRTAALRAALPQDDAALAAVLARNVYGKVEPPPACVAALVAYVRRSVEALRQVPLAELLAGRVDFPEVKSE